MSDGIIFSTIAQAMKFVNQFPYHKFIREESFVTGSFSGLHLRGAKFNGTNLSRVNLSKSNLEGANFLDAHLKEANLTGANLEGANLRNVNLECANVTGTTILSVTAIGSSRKDNLYASPVYDNNGNQVGWGFHAGCFYGSYEDLHKAIVKDYGEGEYSNCLDKLQEMCVMKFNPQQQEQQS